MPFKNIAQDTLAYHYQTSRVFDHKAEMGESYQFSEIARENFQPLVKGVIGRPGKFEVLSGRSVYHYEPRKSMKLHPLLALQAIWKTLNKLENLGYIIHRMLPQLQTPPGVWTRNVAYVKELISYAHMVQIPTNTNASQPNPIYVITLGSGYTKDRKPMVNMLLRVGDQRTHPRDLQFIQREFLEDQFIIDVIRSIRARYDNTDVAQLLGAAVDYADGKLSPVGEFALHSKLYSSAERYKTDIGGMIDYIENTIGRRPPKTTLFPVFNRIGQQSANNVPVFFDMNEGIELLDENNNNAEQLIEADVIDEELPDVYNNIDQITDNLSSDEENPNITATDGVQDLHPVVDRETAEVVGSDGRPNENAVRMNRQATLRVHDIELHPTRKGVAIKNERDNLAANDVDNTFQSIKLDMFISASGMMWNCRDVYFNGRVPEDGIVLADVMGISKTYYDNPEARTTTGTRLGNYVYVKAIHTKITWKLYSGDSANVRLIIGYYNGNPEDQISATGAGEWITNEAGELLGYNAAGLGVSEILQPSPHIDIQNLEDGELPNYAETPTNFSPYNFINHMLDDKFQILFDNYADLNVQAMNTDGVEIVGEGGDVSFGCSYKASRNVKLDDLDLEIMYQSDKRTPYFGNIFYLLIGDYEGGVIQCTMWSRIYYIS